MHVSCPSSVVLTSRLCPIVCRSSSDCRRALRAYARAGQAPNGRDARRWMWPPAPAVRRRSAAASGLPGSRRRQALSGRLSVGRRRGGRPRRPQPSASLLYRGLNSDTPPPLKRRGFSVLPRRYPSTEADLFPLVPDGSVRAFLRCLENVHSGVHISVGHIPTEGADVRPDRE